MKSVIKEALSEGIAIGKVVKKFHINPTVSKGDKASEKAKFNNALMTSLLQINDLLRSNPELSDYLAVHELIILDPELLRRVNNRIDEGMSATDSVTNVFEDYIRELGKSSSRYLYERILDIQDAGERIISNLNDMSRNFEVENGVLVMDTIYPSLIIQHRNSIKGIIAKTGGYTSHAAIICRSWGIPFVVSDEAFRTSDNVIVDTRRGIIIKNPTESESSKYLKEISAAGEDKNAIPHQNYLFLANVAENNEIDNAIKYGFDGIGLYRTEFIFMNSLMPYTLEEQQFIYKEAITKALNKPIIFRTFDISPDKKIPYVAAYDRAIDNYTNNPTIFEDQIKAILSVNVNGNIGIMFPMIKSKEEFAYLKEWVLRIIKENNYNPNVKIGMMLETKNAINHITDFTEADFISVGTNDLTQQLYQIDRDDIGTELDEYLLDLVKKMKKVVAFCKEYNIDLSVCGELAAIPEAALKLYEIGIKNLSVSPSAVAELNLAYKEFINE